MPEGLKQKAVGKLMRLSQSAGGDQVKKVFLNQNKKFRFTPGDLESL